MVLQTRRHPDTVVAMSEPMTHADGLRPGDRPMKRLEVRIDSIGDLAKEDDLTEYRPLGVFIAYEFVFRQPLDRPLGTLDGPDHVQNGNDRIMRHRGTA